MQRTPFSGDADTWTYLGFFLKSQRIATKYATVAVGGPLARWIAAAPLGVSEHPPQGIRNVPGYFVNTNKSISSTTGSSISTVAEWALSSVIPAS